MIEPDPFGSAIEDYANGIREYPCVIERDDGFRTQEELDPYFADEHGWAEEEKEALEALGPTVLDVGCGPGRHLIPLQTRHTVVGLDVSRSVLGVCRQRGGRRLVLGRSTRLPFKSAVFHSVLMMSNGLGLSGGLEETMGALCEVRRTMVSGGRLVAHTSDPTDPESGIQDAYRFQNIEQARPSGLVRVRVVYREIVGPWFELMLMTPRQARGLLSLAGLPPARRIPWDASALYISLPGGLMNAGPRHLFRRLAGVLRRWARRSYVG